MGDLVTDRCDLIDSRQESLLRVLCAGEAGTRLLLDIGSEQDVWQLPEVEVVDDAKRVCTCGTPRKVPRERLTFASGTAPSILDAAKSPNRAT